MVFYGYVLILIVLKPIETKGLTAADVDSLTQTVDRKSTRLNSSHSS